MNAKEFLKCVKEQCAESDIKVDLVDGKSIDVNGTSCTGSFDDRAKILSVAINRPESEWLPILAHEFCHFRQYKENTRAWRNLYCTVVGNTICCVSILDLWLSNEIELTKEQLEKYINTTISVELECEIDTVELIKELELPINIDQYIKQANAYLLSYQAMRVFRRWTLRGRSVIKNKRIMTKMDTKFSYSYHDPLPKSLLEKYIWNFYKD